nr:peptidase M15 [uncultured Mediterranean phage uvMED]|tara:strand:+ start:231 stop:692 length:462 start_codon:yes stop_codon:yes gene_type:complete
MKLTENFNLNELTKSQVAERKGIPNNPSSDHIDSLKKLAESVLQPLRNHYESPVIITSGYRSAELCLAIGSSIESQHAKGQAADLEIIGVSNYDTALWIKNNLDFDQLILEFWKGEDEPNSGWIHVSYVGKKNRKQSLRAFRDDNGKVNYKPW